MQAGEVAYADRQTILTRHFVWRQAQVGLITPSTRSVFLVAEVLGEIEEGVVEAVQTELCSGLQKYFDVVPYAFFVDEQQPAIPW